MLKPQNVISHSQNEFVIFRHFLKTYYGFRGDWNERSVRFQCASFFLN